MSAKQSAKLRDYRKVITSWRKRPENRCCRFPGCLKTKVDPHHTRGRIGALLTAVEFIVPVCREHHIWTENNPNEARKLGLLCGLGEWGKQP